jgi:hypothetical protein
MSRVCVAPAELLALADTDPAAALAAVEAL